MRRTFEASLLSDAVDKRRSSVSCEPYRADPSAICNAFYQLVSEGAFSKNSSSIGIAVGDSSCLEAIVS
jgi:hypothetical protein